MKARFVLLALAFLSVAVATAAQAAPPIEMLNQQGQLSSSAVQGGLHPAPMEVSVKKGGLTLVIKRISPPNSEPGSFELKLATAPGTLSGVTCRIGERTVHPVDGSGSSITWSESGTSNAAVVVTAGGQTLTASLPGGRQLNRVGAGLPGGLRFESAYDPAIGGGVRFSFTLVGEAQALDLVSRVDYKSPTESLVSATRASGFKLEQVSHARDFAVDVTVRLTDGSSTDLRLPVSPPR